MSSVRLLQDSFSHVSEAISYFRKEYNSYTQKEFYDENSVLNKISVFAEDHLDDDQKDELYDVFPDIKKTGNSLLTTSDKETIVLYINNRFKSAGINYDDEYMFRSKDFCTFAFEAVIDSSGEIIVTAYLVGEEPSQDKIYGVMKMNEQGNIDFILEENDISFYSFVEQ